MKPILLRMWKLVKRWFGRFVDKVLENPFRNIIMLIASVYIMFAFAQNFLEQYSILTLIGYILLCIKGITKIIDDPRRTIYWAVGFVFSATAIKLVFEQFITSIDFTNVASIIGVLLTGYVILTFYLESRKLKTV